jgi:hypothetical protein
MVITFQEASKKAKSKGRASIMKTDVFMWAHGTTINSYKSKYDLIFYIIYI